MTEQRKMLSLDNVFRQASQPYDVQRTLSPEMVETVAGELVRTSDNTPLDGFLFSRHDGDLRVRIIGNCVAGLDSIDRANAIKEYNDWKAFMDRFGKEAVAEGDKLGHRKGAISGTLRAARMVNGLSRVNDGSQITIVENGSEMVQDGLRTIGDVRRLVAKLHEMENENGELDMKSGLIDTILNYMSERELAFLVRMFSPVEPQL